MSFQVEVVSLSMNERIFSKILGRAKALFVIVRCWFMVYVSEEDDRYKDIECNLIDGSQM